MTSEAWAILLDLDDTLVLTSAIQHLRRRGMWRQAYAAFAETKLPAGTVHFLQSARKRGRLGVVTRAPRHYAEKLLKHHGLDVSVEVAHRDVLRRKPHPDAILKAAEHLSVPVSRCIYVGDMRSDLEAAANAGALAIGITWGSSRFTKKDAALAYAICDDWDEVLAAIIWAVKLSRKPDLAKYHLPRLKAQLKLGTIPAGGSTERHNYFLFAYHPKDSPSADYITDLILDFKDNDPYAVAQVTKVALSAFTAWEAKLRNDLQCRYIVSIPRSSAGSVNEPCEQVCAALAQRFRWLKHVPGALERLETVEKSSHARRGERPDFGTHRETISYAGRRMHAEDKGIIMLDDVFTKGVVSDACRDILQEATGCRRAVGIFIGRTMRE